MDHVSADIYRQLAQFRRLLQDCPDLDPEDLRFMLTQLLEVTEKLMNGLDNLTHAVEQVVKHVP